MRALVLGGSGAVGRVIVGELADRGWSVTSASRRSSAAAIDLGSPAGIRELARHAGSHDVVINASGVEDPGIVRAAAPAAYVDISATGRALAAMREAAVPGQAVLLWAGLVPGLSTMLVAALPTQHGDDVDLAVILGTGERHGPAAIEWTAALAGQPVFSPPERETVMNLREWRRLPSQRGPRGYFRADFPDHWLADAGRGIRVRSYLAAGGALTTAALGLVGRFPRLAPLLARAPHLGTERWSLVVQNRRTGARVSAAGVRQSRAAGVLAALGAEALVRGGVSGVVTMADTLRLDAVPELFSNEKPMREQCVMSR